MAFMIGKGLWYFLDECQWPTGPYKSDWEAEKVKSSYLLVKQGIGDNDLLYVDLDKFIRGATAPQEETKNEG